LSGEFKHLDRGVEENLKKYGVAKPNDFNMQNIQGFKIALICG
jgi:hypothetical protein